MSTDRSTCRGLKSHELTITRSVVIVNGMRIGRIPLKIREKEDGYLHGSSVSQLIRLTLFHVDIDPSGIDALGKRNSDDSSRSATAAVPTANAADTATEGKAMEETKENKV